MGSTSQRRILLWLAGVAGVAIVGGVDYGTGAELRIFPLYYLPITLIAWHFGTIGAWVIAALCALAWCASNYLAGMSFSHQGLWAANAVMLGASFAIVALLIATLRAALVRERVVSRTDPLTGLLNTRAFYDESARLLALCRRKGYPVTVAYLDLDNFKLVNDTLGHKAGDALLVRVAALLRRSVRPSDLFARVGGDEFALFLPEVGPEEARLTLERLRALLAATFAGDSRPMTGTFGAVTFVRPPADVEEMVHEADSRMYAGKNAGKNCVHVTVVN